jgi:DegV family protein with EDD domain
MPHTVIVTDSSTCLPGEMLRRSGAIVVPLAVLYNGKSYRDGEIDPAEFAEWLRARGEYPTTAAPAPGEFLDAFRQAQEGGAEAVLCLTLSSQYSGTHHSAIKAAELAERELPGLPLRIVDTGGIAMMHGYAVLDAAGAAARGASLDEAAAAAALAAKESHLVGLLDGTEYLAKSGRVPRVLHIAASALGIKPLIASTHGKIAAAGRVRTTEQGIERLVQFVKERTASQEPPRVAVMHAAEGEAARRLAERVRETLKPHELMETEFTPAMAVHTGPGFLGLAWRAQDPVPETRAAFWRRRDAVALERALGPLPAAVEQPALVMLCGLPGSGKSYLAREIAGRYPLAVLNSDALRRTLVRRPAYSQKESARLFSAIHAVIEDLLRRGIPTLLDATNLKEAHRRPVYEIAERTRARLLVVEVRAPEDAIRARLEARRAREDPADISEATVAVYETMRDEAEPIERPHMLVNTTADIVEAVARIMSQLRGVRA